MRPPQAPPLVWATLLAAVLLAAPAGAHPEGRTTAGAGPRVAPLGVNITSEGWSTPNGCGKPPIVERLSGAVEGGTPPYRYAWAFGDGNYSSDGPQVVHAYAEWGVYNVSLTVTDSLEVSANRSTLIALYPPPCPSSFNPLLASPAGVEAAIAVAAIVIAVVLLSLVQRRRGPPPAPPARRTASEGSEAEASPSPSSTGPAGAGPGGSVPEESRQ
jgi:hypothetical protein